MTIQEATHIYSSLPQVKALELFIKEERHKNILLKGLTASAPAMLFAALAHKVASTFLFVMNDNDEAGYFYNDLKTMLSHSSQYDSAYEVLFFPSSFRRAIKFGQRDAANQILRTEVLTRLSAAKSSNDTSHPKPPLLIVTEPSAISELVISQQQLDSKRLTLSVGKHINITKVGKTLREFGFKEVLYVYEPGEFAIRGSIIDVYSFSGETPYRIDFFGDDIDTIRTFEIESQLSIEKKTSIDIVPELAKVAHEKVSFLKFLPQETTIVFKNFLFVRDSIDKIYKDGFSHQALTEQLEGKTEVEQDEIKQRYIKETQLLSPAAFTTDATAFKRIEIISTDHSLSPLSSTYKQQDIISFNTTPQPLFHKNFDLLITSLRDYMLKGYHIYIFADSKKQTARLKDIFDSKAEQALQENHSYSDKAQSNGRHIAFTPVENTLHEGFVDDDKKICFFTDHQIFDRFHKYSLSSDKARRGKAALTMKELQEMEPGDYLVHIDLGIGKFAGLVRVPVKNSYQEMIRLVFQNNVIVDISIHSLYKISKYKRADTDEPPRLSVLGSGAWERLKEKAKKRIKDIARDLIKLYAKRRHEKGFAFSPDSFMQHELEASFLYEDTPDQLKATQDLKQDMESSQPMDRLICGDVGFGKTEVAIRAAFKAAADNKQVAVLVPTTVLALQHYKSFQNRLKDMPVTIDYLSRARTTKQTKQILSNLATGKIDILIGTHKLLGKTVKWHDLGLLIIDEEQKFGVSTKEKLRQIKTNVDTLTMTATPIPRTLQFSLMGARDMSIMKTPPPNRYPIQTEIIEFDPEAIAEAINFEMSRNGQVFFVNDRIGKLQDLAAIIRKNVPDCRIAIGHGQMKPEELEEIIIGFMNYDYDLLLSTTIVENGIDISNANTIIINDAHHFGLSDLHQMRGRVGRSNKKAFCYLITPPMALLNTEARRRIEALETFSDLGSGFNLAMQDLDIRGAGNLLGAEQSGFMEDLGYETYQKILSQAVTELRNDEFHDLYTQQQQNGIPIANSDFVDDCTIGSDLEMYFPDNYIPGASERMLLYRELDNINEEKELEEYRKRLEDRFGPVPQQGEELMHVVALRRIGKRLGCEKIILKQGNMHLQFVSNPKSYFYQSDAFNSILSYIATYPKRCNLKEKKGKRLMVISNVTSSKDAIEILRKIESKHTTTLKTT
jgi:transcription-repair coupling factor